MLTHPTLDQLNQLGLYGMAKAFGEVIASAELRLDQTPSAASELHPVSVDTKLSKQETSGLIGAVAPSW